MAQLACATAQHCVSATVVSRLSSCRLKEEAFVGKRALRVSTNPGQVGNRKLAQLPRISERSHKICLVTNARAGDRGGNGGKDSGGDVRQPIMRALSNVVTALSSSNFITETDNLVVTAVFVGGLILVFWLSSAVVTGVVGLLKYALLAPIGLGLSWLLRVDSRSDPYVPGSLPGGSNGGMFNEDDAGINPNGPRVPPRDGNPDMGAPPPM
eukprot:jgi/Mesvir1/3476/Mv11967-RA.1